MSSSNCCFLTCMQISQEAGFLTDFSKSLTKGQNQLRLRTSRKLSPRLLSGDIRHAGLIPESGRSSGGGRGNPLQYSCLENPMDRGAWQATVHEVTESDRNELLTLLLSKQGQKLAKMCISKNYIHFGSGNWRKIHNIKLWVKFYSGTLLKTIALELVSQITPRNCPKR